MLLSTLEIGQICHEQNVSYCRLIGAAKDLKPWNELDPHAQAAIEKKVRHVMAGETTEEYVLEPLGNVQRIMEGLFKDMVLLLMEI